MKSILRLVAQRFPGPPIETILRWAEEFIGTSDDTTWMLDAEFPEALAIPTGQQPGVFLAALRSFISDEPASTAATPALSPADHQRLRETFASSSLKPLLM